MGRVLFLAIATIGALSHSSFAEQTKSPRIQWQQTVGGSSYDQPLAVAVTRSPDSGFVFAGTSTSGISGNKTSPSHDTDLWNGDYSQPNAGDYWLVKLDSKGRKQWDRSFGFGNLDQLWNFQQLPSGCFMLGGYSVTGKHVDPFLGLVDERDTWLVHTDSRGGELWNYRFSDAGLDYPLSVLPTDQDDFLVVGDRSLGWLDGSGIRLPNQLLVNSQVQSFSVAQLTSDDGVVLAGSLTQPPVFTNGVFISGHWDIWLGRYKPDGTERWQRTYGGAGSESVSQVLEIPDGGLLVVGSSSSPPDENKTAPLFDEPDPDSSIPFAGDVWMVRTDRDGNKLWDRSFGTAKFDWPGIVLPTSDGGVLLQWWSLTDDDFDAVQHLTRVDGAGNELWTRPAGLFLSEQLVRILEMSDGGFLLGGYAPAGTNDLKHDFGFGGDDCWLLRFDAAGNRLWDMTLGGSGGDGLRDMEKTEDGGFILAIASSSPADGNKTSPNYGGYDLWAVKLGPERQPDSDGDGVPDDLDQCPNSPRGAVVDQDGCSIDQLVPCDGEWKNHGQYVKAVIRVTGQFRKAGLISGKQRLQIFLRAVKSDCGKKRSKQRVY